MSLRAQRKDEGAILPLVMVCSVLMSVIVVALTGYVTADLRYTRVVEDRADRLAAADGGLRYGIENLRNFKSLCTTKAGTGGGFTTIFPPTINGALSKVTCRRVGNGISDVQGWGVVVTGEGVPSGQPYFTTSGAGGSGGNVKTFSGPVYINDPLRIDLKARLVIENGDLWYSRDDCETEVVIPEVSTGYLEFIPDFFRGPTCTDLSWSSGLFTPPTALAPPAEALVDAPPPDDTDPNCRVFFPGKYTALNLASSNYFQSGDYYFENVTIEVQSESILAGFPSGYAGDAQKIDSTACAIQMTNDPERAVANAKGGATFYLGGGSRINVDTQGQFEIFRRKQNETFLGLVAVPPGVAGAVESTLGWNDLILETKSGNTNDVAIHGLFWAPLAKMSLGNVTNAANGQLLGGVVLANMDTQASASASAFAIGIEANPVDTRLLLVSTAEKNGEATTIRAVLQFRPDTGELAVNSWRVQN
jgi:hypothetical protein